MTDTDPTATPRAQLRVHLHVIERDVAAFVTRHRQAIRCGPGCGSCCHQTFRISELEGELIREGVAQLPNGVRQSIADRAQAYRPDRRDPCPLLTPDQRCSVYAHRPRICRKYGTPLWHPDRPHEFRTCPLNFCDGEEFSQDAQQWVTTQAEWAMAWIGLRRGCGPQVNRTIAEWIVSANPDPTE